jgi:RimJ/RimL family protein N-acetyltransferase
MFRGINTGAWTMINPFLIGESVYLRPLERLDAPAIVPWLNHPEVMRTIRIFRPLNLTAEEEHIERIQKSENAITLGIMVRSTDRFIGVAGLHEIDFKNRQTGYGIVIGEKDEWGKGYGAEVSKLLVGYAFRTLNLNRVWLHVYTNNERGMRCYPKAGFRQEGVLRQAYYQDGRYWDTITFAILRQEWDAQPQ